jgi:hypothetical protein
LSVDPEQLIQMVGDRGRQPKNVTSGVDGEYVRRRRVEVGTALSSEVGPDHRDIPVVLDAKEPSCNRVKKEYGLALVVLLNDWPDERDSRSDPGLGAIVQPARELALRGVAALVRVEEPIRVVFMGRNHRSSCIAEQA